MYIGEGMDIMSKAILKRVKYSKWDKVKMELTSLDYRLWDEIEKYKEFEEKVNEFITFIEENGLLE